MKFIQYIHLVSFIVLLATVCSRSAAQSINSFSTDLPLIIIDTEGRTIVDDSKVKAKMKIIANTNAVNKFTDLPNDYNGYIGIELRGSSSINYPQKPYLFETRTAAGENMNFPVLGLPEENDWLLISNYNDKSLMRNILAYQLFEKSGNYAPRTKLVDVVLNNVYQGIYILTEKIKQDSNRVNIAKLKSSDISGEEVTGGYIFKIDYWDNNNSWQSPYSPFGYPEYKIHFVYYDPDWDELVTQQKTYISNYVTSFERALYSTGFKDETQGYPKYIDVESFIDYFIVNEVARNNDGFKKSQYFHKDKNGKIVAGPVWDFDWAWKNIDECYIFSATDGSGWAYKVNACNPDVKSPGWMERLFQDEKFKNNVNCTYFEARAGYLSNEAVLSVIDSLYNVVKNAQVKHFQKWQTLGVNVGAPEVDQQPATYSGEVDKLKNWIIKRLSWLDKNMPGKCSSVGVSEIAENNGFNIYPNPATSQINVTSRNEIAYVKIYDLTGRVLYINSVVNSGSLQIDVSEFNRGMVILSLYDKNGNHYSEKVVVK